MCGLDRRVYRRSHDFNGDAFISEDGVYWSDVRISNLSSGGLRFYYYGEFEVGKELYFRLRIRDYFTEFEVEAKGVIRSAAKIGRKQVYGVEFSAIAHDARIRIDEVIKGCMPKGIWNDQD